MLSGGSADAAFHRSGFGSAAHVGREYGRETCVDGIDVEGSDRGFDHPLDE